MNDLERRYLRLLRCYPREYRRARGAEIVGTYLELADPGRRWPSAADAADCVVGGLRQHLRAAGAVDAGPGFRMAGVLALLTASVCAGGWAVLELNPPPAAWGVPGVGPFVSLGVGVWAAWLIVAAGYLLAPGRWTRPAIGVATLLTAAVVPAAALTGQPRPPMFVLLPQMALGIVALGAPAHAPRRLRLLPLAAAGPAAITAVNLLPRHGFHTSYYGWTATQVLPAAAVGLLIAVALLGIGLALRGDRRGGWALLVLSTPIGMLSLHPLAGAVAGALSGAPNPTWASLAAAALAVGLIGPALVPLAVTVRARLGGTDRTGEPCPTCGAHR